MANPKNLSSAANHANDGTMDISTNSTYNDDCTSNHANYYDDQSDSSTMQDEYQCIEEFEKKLDYFNELIDYNKEKSSKRDSSKDSLFTDRFRPPGILIFSILYKSIKHIFKYIIEDPVKKFQEMLFEQQRKQNAEKIKRKELKNVSLQLETYSECPKILSNLKLPYRAGYQMIIPNYYKKIFEQELELIKNVLTCMDESPVYRTIIPRILLACKQIKTLFPFDAEYFFNSINNDVNQLLMNPEVDIRIKEQFRTEIINKMLHYYFPFEDEIQDNINIYHKRLNNDFFCSEKNTDFESKFETKNSRLTFKCWSCKYFFQIGNSQNKQFYQFQFKDFCSIECLRSNVINNGRCSYCYLKNDESSSPENSPLDWANCKYSFTFYHPNDIGKAYLEIFHDELHQLLYCKTFRLCKICKAEITNPNLNELLYVRVSENLVDYYCKYHKSEYRIKTQQQPKKIIQCLICKRQCFANNYCQDYPSSNRLTFCGKKCKLLFFKVNYKKNRCTVCFKKLAIDPNDDLDGNYIKRYYLIRCLWTLYTVCSEKCYQNFRYNYRFKIKCNNCSYEKYHCDMIGIMKISEDNLEKLSENCIQHYCSLQCYYRAQKSEPYSQCIPLANKKFRYTDKIECDIVLHKCLTCLNKFGKPRSSLLQHCSWKCLNDYHSNINIRNQQENNSMVDHVFNTEFSKLRRKKF